MAHVVDSYDMSLKYFLFPLDPWPLSEKVHFFFTAESRHHTPHWYFPRRHGWIHRGYDNYGHLPVVTCYFYGIIHSINWFLLVLTTDKWR